MDDPLTFLTDFGDQAVILPLLLAVALVLWAQRRWRVAGAWLLATPGVLGTILVLKVVCYACGWLLPVLGIHGLNLRSPSGHAASAAVAYGGIAAIVAARWRHSAGFVASRMRLPAAVSAALLPAGMPAEGPAEGPGRAAPAAATRASMSAASAAALITALAVAALVGTTRVELGAHSRSEVLVAAAVGTAGAVAFAWLAGRRIGERSGLPVAAAALVVVALFHGRHLPAEGAIQQAASGLVRRVITACEPG